jgi:hypothetical protein
MTVPRFPFWFVIAWLAAWLAVSAERMTEL